MEMKHFMIVDLVKHKGDTLSLINSVIAYVRSKHLVQDVRWYVRDDQTRFLQSSALTRIASYESEDPVAGVLNWISELSQENAEGAIVHVLSYDGVLLGRAATLNGPSLIVSTMHMSNVYEGGSRFAVTRPPSVHSVRKPYNVGASQYAEVSYNGSGPFTLEKAIHLAQCVLKAGGHMSESTSLHQPLLRPLMTRIDSRARKTFNDPTSSQLITYIINAGLSEGWLGQVRGWQTGSEYIWLLKEVQVNETPVIAEVEDSTTKCHQTPIPAESVPTNVPAYSIDAPSLSATPSYATPPSATPPPATPLSATLSSEMPSTSVPPSATPRSTERLVTFETNGNGSAKAGVAIADKNTNSTEVRPWKVMESKLRERGIGSPSEPRQFLFDAVEAVIRAKAEDQSVKVGVLMAKAQEIAMAEATKSGYARAQNWPAISKCFLRMLLESEVLLKSDGTPVSNEIGGRSAEVASLRSDFRDCCEAVLLETIVKGIGGVRFCDRDFHSLGLALFQRGTPNGVDEFNERVDYLLRVLEFNGRIDKNGDGLISVRSNLNGNPRWLK